MIRRTRETRVLTLPPEYQGGLNCSAHVAPHGGGVC